MPVFLARRLTDVLVTASGFELNSAAGSGGAILASNLNYSLIVVDSGFDCNKAASEQVLGLRVLVAT